jgi:hypothetical protein
LKGMTQKLYHHHHTESTAVSSSGPPARLPEPRSVVTLLESNRCTCSLVQTIQSDRSSVTCTPVIKLNKGDHITCPGWR